MNRRRLGQMAGWCLWAMLVSVGGCGGGGSTPQAPTTLTGAWSFSGQNAASTNIWSVGFQLTQQGTNVTSQPIAGQNGGEFQGATITANTFQGQIVGMTVPVALSCNLGTLTVNVTGTVATNWNSMSGTWTSQGAGLNMCPESGTWTATRE